MKKNSITRFTACILLGLSIHFTAGSQVISQLSFYSPLISTFDMKYVDNHMVVAQNGLLIFDVTNPAVSPKLVGQTTYPGGYAYQLAVQNHFAYMAEGSNGLFAIYDISNFSAPALKGSFPIPSTSFYLYGDLEIQGNYAYLSGFDSLFVINVANAAAPVLAKAIEVEHTDFSGAEDIVIDGNTLFLRTSFGIQLYDISNPANPVWTNRIAYTHTYNSGLAVDTVNHRIFQPWITALQEFTGYDAFDVSNPAAPKFLFRDSIAFVGGEFGKTAYSYFDTTLFISKGGGINAFDVTPNAHRFVTTFTGEDIPNSSISIQVKDSIIYHARGGGLEVLKYSFSPVSVCAVPEGLKQAVNGTRAVLHWTKVPGAVSYVVAYRVIGTNDWEVAAAKDNFTTLSNLLPNKVYTWQVRTVCKLSRGNLSDWSLYNVFRTGAGKGSDLVVVSPNPVDNMMHIHVKDISVSKLIITDQAGLPQIKISNVKPDQDINCSSLPTGTYVLQLYGAKNELIGSINIMKR